MNSTNELTDSTDWLNTPLSAFVALDNALRCQVCKDFYDTPMLTSSDGKCPACRAGDQANKLRRNWAVEECVSAFLSGRPAALEVARREDHDEHKAGKSKARSGKRKRAVTDTDEEVEEQRSARKTRSRSKMEASQQVKYIEIGNSEEEDCCPDDGLVACPACGKRMKEEAVFSHLDRCDAEREDGSKRQSRSRSAKSPYFAAPNGVSQPAGRAPLSSILRQPSALAANARPLERLPEMNYSLLKDNALRKKLQELGIPAWGSKGLMMKRHIEWINLWNSNCDSSRPRPKRELLHDLEVWERTQGGRVPDGVINGAGGGSSVMKKDFDGAEWAASNRDDFKKLIEEAKRKKSTAEPAPGSKSVVGTDERSSPPATGSAQENAIPTPATSPPHSPSTEQSQRPSNNPYENNPEAISSIRAKVAAANAGQEVRSVMNKHFEGPPTRDVSAPGAPPAEAVRDVHDTLSLAPEAQHRHKSNAEERQDPTDSPCVLRDRVASPPARKMPMFCVPEEPVTDIETSIQ
ncbi:E3 ubiquitin-protein ligase rad18 [Elasticomyces elasticus]|nr:E3 ubiquitin-protein ligase rad18 [Elasticomyces elasticus]